MHRDENRFDAPAVKGFSGLERRHFPDKILHGGFAAGEDIGMSAHFLPQIPGALHERVCQE